MKIYQLRLVNVKSYVDETLDFQPGINFISGINGAGKSTIIESIGYALFNFNPYVLRQFLRDGASQGEIQVVLEGVDERLYRVVRKFTASANTKWEVWDEETASMLQELHGSDDVSRWLKDIMGIAQSEDLADLFRQVIAVQQGLFTAPFNEPPAQRRKTFDAILKVEDYREAFERTSPLEQRFNHEIRRLISEREILGQTLAELPEVEERLRSGQQLEGRKQVELAKLEADLKINMERLTKNEEQKAALDSLQKELAVLSEQINGIHQQKVDLMGQIKEAQAAQNIVEKHKPGYDRYLAIQQELRTLEIELQEKQTLLEQVRSLRLELATGQARLEADGTRWESERGELNQSLDAQKKKVLEEEHIALSWQRIGEEFSRFRFLGRVWLEATSKIAPWASEYGEILEGVRQQRERIAYLRQTMGEGAKAAEDLPRLEAELNALEQADRLEFFRDEQATKRAELDALTQNEHYLKQGICPIIQEACPSERVSGTGLNEYFQERSKMLQEELGNIELSVHDSLENRKKQVQLKERIQTIRLQQAQLEEQLSRESQYFHEISLTLGRLRWGNFYDYATEMAELAARYEQEREVLEHKLGRWSLDVSLELVAPPRPFPEPPKLVETKTAEELDFCLNHLRSWQETFFELQLAWERFGQKWQGVLNEVASQLELKLRLAESVVEQGKKQLETLDVKNEELTKELQRFQETEAQLGHVENQLTCLKGQVQEVGPLEDKIRGAKVELESLESSYNLYQTNLKGSQKLEVLQIRLGDIEKIQVDLEKSKKEKTKGEQLLRAQYVSEAHQTLAREVQDQREISLTLRRDLQELAKGRKELRVRLTRLQDTQGVWEAKGKELQEQQLALELTKGLRYVLRAAAEPIAGQYRKSLSLVATEMYRHVSGENVRIEWGSEYELQLVDYDSGVERVRVFRQLSGGEQMTAALAVRLALMQLLSPVSMGFFDEPTTNLDQDRRESLAMAIQAATSGFEQLFVISHDDSFDAITENVISLNKSDTEGTTLI